MLQDCDRLVLEVSHSNSLCSGCEVLDHVMQGVALPCPHLLKISECTLTTWLWFKAVFTSENFQLLMYTILERKHVLYKANLVSWSLTAVKAFFHSCWKHEIITSSGASRILSAVDVLWISFVTPEVTFILMFSWKLHMQYLLPGTFLKRARFCIKLFLEIMWDGLHFLGQGGDVLVNTLQSRKSIPYTELYMLFQHEMRGGGEPFSWSWVLYFALW